MFGRKHGVVVGLLVVLACSGLKVGRGLAKVGGQHRCFFVDGQLGPARLFGGDVGLIATLVNPDDFKTAAGKDYKKADYDAMFTAENGKGETTLATATAPPGGP